MTTPEILTYNIKPTNLMPNSPKPLLLYKNCFLVDGKVSATLAFDTFRKNGWETQWVTTYGHFQRSHYHPSTHEVMVVMSGPGKIRWGTADFGDDAQAHTYGGAAEEGAVYVDANVGDVFVVPAGVAHKNYDPAQTNPDFVPLTGMGAHGIDSEDPRGLVGELGPKVKGFTMMGAYPRGLDWGWSEGGEHVGSYEGIWSVGNPELDPIFGSEGGIHTYWKGGDSSG